MCPGRHESPERRGRPDVSWAGTFHREFFRRIDEDNVALYRLQAVVGGVSDVEWSKPSLVQAQDGAFVSWFASLIQEAALDGQQLAGPLRGSRMDLHTAAMERLISRDRSASASSCRPYRGCLGPPSPTGPLGRCPGRELKCAHADPLGSPGTTRPCRRR